ncbi:MAG: hypothetical protein IPK29_10810 [Betaproteobacteria bacterium]|nr:hypothetical protein [Betaproteobacteria bacterium]
MARVQETNEADWHPVETGGLVAFVLFTLYVLWFSHTGERWVPLLDGANLAFHEAGHPLFGLLGERLAVYGGTVGQLVFPTAALVAFWQRREAVSWAVCAVWLAGNLFNIARYMADARAKLLPLVGGLDPEYSHDWDIILRRWGLLNLDTTLALALRLAGWALALAVAWWLLRRWMAGRESG